MLAQALGLPADAVIQAVFTDQKDLHTGVKRAGMIVSSPNMPRVAEGNEVPVVDLEDVKGEQ
jgi:hypothetical protein